MSFYRTANPVIHYLSAKYKAPGLDVNHTGFGVKYSVIKSIPLLSMCSDTVLSMCYCSLVPPFICCTNASQISRWMTIDIKLPLSRNILDVP